MSSLLLKIVSLLWVWCVGQAHSLSLEEVEFSLVSSHVSEHLSLLIELSPSLLTGWSHTTTAV